jgi:FAD/FMN-containing dehydrogenase
VEPALRRSAARRDRPLRDRAFIDRGQRDWRRAYYGDAYERLAAIKRAVDPDRVFRFRQAV